MGPGNCVGATALWMEAGWCFTTAVSAWYSTHQLSSLECAMKRSCTPLGRQNSAYMGIYGHMQQYIHVFTCIYTS